MDEPCGLMKLLGFVFSWGGIKPRPSLETRKFGQTPLVLAWFFILKVRQSRKVFFKPTILPKNERTNSLFRLTVLWSYCFVRFSKEFEDSKKSFWNWLTFRFVNQFWHYLCWKRHDEWNPSQINKTRLGTIFSILCKKRRNKKSQTEFVSSSCFAQYLNDHWKLLRKQQKHSFQTSLLFCKSHF